MFDVDKYMHKPFYGCNEPEHKKPAYTQTEQVEQTARLMRETIDRLLRFEERAKTELADLSRNLTSDNVIFKSAMHEAWTTFLLEVKNEINVFEGNLEADVKLFKSDLETNYANIIERVNEKIVEFETKYEGEFTKLGESVSDLYNSFVENVNARIDGYNDNHAQAFADYQRKLTTDLNMFEQSMTTNFATFTEGVNASVQAFKDTWEQIITERLSAQDGRISDTEMYMKVNLEASVRSMIGDMHTNGEFVDIIEGEVFNDLERKVDGFGRVSIKYFGARGDGETDDTSAFELAFASGYKIFIPRGIYIVGDITIPEHCDILCEGVITISHDEAFHDEFLKSKYAVIELAGTWTLAPHVRIEGGIFKTAGKAFEIDVAEYEHQGIDLNNVSVIGDGSTNAMGLYINASDNTGSKTGYLTLSRFNMLINKCYYGIYIHRPQTTGRHPWITFVTFEGALTECYQGIRTNYGNIAHANGSGVYRLTCCGGAIYKNNNEAYIDISGDMPTVDILFSDIGEGHSIKYGLDLTGTRNATVYNYPQGHAIFKNKHLYGERFVVGGKTVTLGDVTGTMPDGRVTVTRSGGTIDFLFYGTFGVGTHVDFGGASPYTRGAFDTTYRDSETNLLIQMAGNNSTILVSNETGAPITISTPIKISVPHHTLD